MIFKKTILYYFMIILIASSNHASVDTFFNQLKYSYDNNQPFQLISTQQSSFNLNMAYKLQKKWTSFLEETSNKIGYKASLTNVESQKKYNINSPISGVLFNNLLYKNFDIIPLNKYKNPILEIELGFYLNSDIMTTINNKNTLKRYIKNMVCIIEIPDINVENMNQLNIIDLVSINSGSNSIIIGEPLMLSSRSEPFTISLNFNNKLIESIQVDSILDSQLENLMWLVNHIVNLEGKVKKDDLLITGALNKVNQLKKGRYIINYDDKTSIIFHTK